MLDFITNLSSINLTSLLGYLRDLSVILTLLTVVWKIRGAWDEVINFRQDCTRFMTKMEVHADTMVNNHLKHIEEDSKKIKEALEDQTVLLRELQKK